MMFQIQAPEEQRGIMRRNPDRPPTREEFWDFFWYLQSTGKTNMMAAPDYAAFYLDVPKQEARDAFWDWVDLPNKPKKVEALLLNEPNTC